MLREMVRVVLTDDIIAVVFVLAVRLRIPAEVVKDRVISDGLTVARRILRAERAGNAALAADHQVIILVLFRRVYLRVVARVEPIVVALYVGLLDLEALLVRE